MPRRSKKSSPKPLPRPSRGLEAADSRLKGNPPPDTQMSNPIPEDLESGIIKNWNLPEPNINTCVEPKHWPRNEPDPKKWHIDIVQLLHEASTINVKDKDSNARPSNGLFQSDLAREISRRKSKNKSRQGQVDWMTATDLKVIIKRLHSMAEDEKSKKTLRPEAVETVYAGNQRSGVRRGRSKANNTTDKQESTKEANGTESTQQEEKKSTTRGRGRPNKSDTNGEDEVKPSTKRQASDLPIRPARKLRGVKSPKSKPAAPPPVTPANPSELEDSDAEEEDQENEPPEPVSGRHIYGDFIKPTTIDFVAAATSEAPAHANTRQTRKRGRADNEKPPTEEQIDSDPRDIDATGFLSELDPKEARRRRKPRLSRLQDDVVLEPAWSQDVPPPETPLLTPATDGPISGTPAAPVQVNGGPAAQGTNGGETTSLGIKMLLELLPGIPDNATDEERSILEDRVALIHRDIVAYKMAVAEINERTEETG